MLRKLIQSTVIMTMVQLLAIQVAASASLSLFNDAAVSSNISLNKDGTMELGHWRNSIANRIYPNFYSDLQVSPTELMMTRS